jgi:hypothetical protein
MTDLNNTERQELEELRARVERIELTQKDMQNPNVRLIEGRIDLWGDGEYSAVSVKTCAGSVYISEVLKDLVGWGKAITTFCWYVSCEPKGFYELEEHTAKIAIGAAKVQFSHAYSDLTGYLWTNESIEIDGHDVLKEICETVRAIQQESHGVAYIALRVEKSA